ncbi:class I SAM-dependent methyltransferase [Streptomyces zaomyceticus]|uniref:class I SAM-dependent methyltransferase n=1 Tax=Streptomyces zaomyceticus TaxID=68286 RepID=UPI0034355EB7
MSAQETYDEIGEAFEGFKGLPLARYVEAPSFLGMVGDVSGRKVIDLACGTGFYSRELKRRGAADVFGVDVSGEMIRAAEGIEQAAPLGVRYAVGDVAELPSAEEPFDLATAVMLLNYAESVDEFELMCRRVHESLRSGGEFLMLHQTPDFDFSGPSPRPYGFLTELTGEEGGTGPRVRITALLEGRRSRSPPAWRVARCSRRVWRRPGSARSPGCRRRCLPPGSPRTARTSGRTTGPTRRSRCCAAAPDVRAARGGSRCVRARPCTTAVVHDGSGRAGVPRAAEIPWQRGFVGVMMAG